MLGIYCQKELESSIPSSTVSTGPTTPEGKQTRAQSRALRAKIEDLDDLRRTVEQIVRRVEKRAATDDIRTRVMQVASGFEKLAQLEPAMFEDVLDEELAKYDKFLKEMEDAEKRQNVILNEIKVQLF